MISKKTCQDVWNCYSQIENAQKLITDMKEQLEKTGNTDLIDAFGRKQGLQLGVPSGDNSHRLFGVRMQGK